MESQWMFAWREVTWILTGNGGKHSTRNSEETVEERKTNSDGDDGRFLGLKTYRPA